MVTDTTDNLVHIFPPCNSVSRGLGMDVATSGLPYDMDSLTA